MKVVRNPATEDHPLLPILDTTSLQNCRIIEGSDEEWQEFQQVSAVPSMTNPIALLRRLQFKQPVELTSPDERQRDCTDPLALVELDLVGIALSPSPDQMVFYARVPVDASGDTEFRSDGALASASGHSVETFFQENCKFEKIMYFLLITIPYSLLNLSKFLWFEHVSYHKARCYTHQICSFCFVFVVIEVVLVLRMKHLAHHDSDDSLSFSTQILHNLGMVDATSFVCDGEYYRVLTQIFLHLNYQHLWSNVFWQLWYGCYYNVLFGSWNFLLIWFIGGMYGAIAHMVMKERNGLVGASGSCYALDGAFLVWIIYHSQETPNTQIRLFFRNYNWLFIAFVSYAALIMVDGTVSDKPDHTGGFWIGLLLGLCLFRNRTERDNEADRSSSDLQTINRSNFQQRIAFYTEESPATSQQRVTLWCRNVTCDRIILALKFCGASAIIIIYSYSLYYLFNDVKSRICK